MAWFDPSPPAPRTGTPRVAGTTATKIFVAFLLISVAGAAVAFWMTTAMAEAFGAGLATNQRWHARTDAIARLHGVAAELDAPGNDVFTTRDAATERTVLGAARHRFEDALGAIRAELRGGLAVAGGEERAEIEGVLEAMDVVEGRAREVVRLGERTFEAFDEAAFDEAATHMVAMDHAASSLHERIDAAAARSRGVQLAHFVAQGEDEATLRHRALGAACSVLALVTVLGALGYRTARAAEAARLALAVESQARARAAEETRGILETSADAIITATSEGDILEMNPAAVSLLATDAKALEGVLLSDLLPPAGRSSAWMSWASADGVEVHVQPPGRPAVPCSLRVRTGLRPGTVIVFLRDLSDVTRRIAAEAEAREAAERANAAKSQFLANMSHEIRTPMTAVLGFTDLLMDPDLSDADRLEHATTIRRNAEHLLAMLSDLLDLSKIEAGMMTLEPMQVDARQLFADVASLMRPRALDKGLHFEITCASAVPLHVRTDPTRLKQIVLNLVANAIKFTEAGSVTVTLRHHAADAASGGAARLEVDVADTGIGMTREQGAKLFSPFVQADDSTTRRFGGTGLGLAISRRLARSLGGELSFESDVGRGSTFRLSVTAPALGAGTFEEIAGAQGTEPVSSRSDEALPIRVLLAEDGPENRRLLETILTRVGAEVVTVADGRGAVGAGVAALRAGQPFDVVLLDMQMPVLDGYGAAAELRLAGIRSPILAVTASAMIGDRDRCIAAGCDDVITKPIDRAGFVRTVRAFARTRPARASDIPSSLADDPDLRELVDEFVRALPGRIATLERALLDGDFATAQRFAHDLKGSGGAFGFDVVTEVAARIESGILAGQRWPELRALCGRLSGLATRLVA